MRGKDPACDAEVGMAHVGALLDVGESLGGFPELLDSHDQALSSARSSLPLLA